MSMSGLKSIHISKMGSVGFTQVDFHGGGKGHCIFFSGMLFHADNLVTWSYGMISKLSFIFVI